MARPASYFGGWNRLARRRLGETGLITTRRSGTRVLHLRTAMGNGLVHGR